MRVFIAAYLAGYRPPEDLTEKDCPNPPVESILESFYYMDKKKEKLILDNPWHVLLDSGAFSAFTQQETIDRTKYLQYVQGTKDHWDLVAALDVIGDAEASWANFEFFRQEGVLTMPCFHYGEPWDFLEKMVAEAPYIAIGGVAQLGSGPALNEWLDAVWDGYLTHSDGTSKVPVHGFAITGRAMLRYPWASVDSTSWLQSAVRGTVAIDLPDGRGGIRDLKLSFSDRSPKQEEFGNHFTTIPLDLQAVVEKRLGELGYTVEALAADYRWRQHANIGFYRRCESRAVTTFVRHQPGLFF